MTTCKCYLRTRAGKIKRARDLQEFTMFLLVLPVVLATAIITVGFYILSLIQ